MGYTIFHDVPISVSPKVVYDAVCLPEQLIRWWPLKCTGVPNVGATYNFFFTPEYDWLGKVITADESKSFHIKMTKSDADWDPTSFGFDLLEKDTGTLLQFWHKDWPQCNAHFKRSSYCWALLLHGLKDYLEKGVLVPFDQRS